MNSQRLRFLLLASLLGLGACNEMPVRDPAYAATLPAALPEIPAQQADGAIYHAGRDQLLFQDLKARRIGDLLTIKLVEKTDASKKSNTKSDRTTSGTVTNPTILGTTPVFDLPGALPLASTTNNTLAASLSSTHSFDGSGESKQSNSLTGDITVTVADVFPNGNLYVRGEKRMNLNQGNEYIKISGIIRPVDINAADNSVDSTKLADATIIYSQDGEVADANKLGWLARFFISAIFPF